MTNHKITAAEYRIFQIRHRKQKEKRWYKHNKESTTKHEAMQAPTELDKILGKALNLISLNGGGVEDSFLLP